MGGTQLLLRVSPEFKKTLQRERAEQRGMSMNEFIVYRLTHNQTPDRSYNTAIATLSRVNQDLARLGNLLNQAMYDPVLGANKDAIAATFAQIAELQREMKDAARALPR